MNLDVSNLNAEFAKWGFTKRFVSEDQRALVFERYNSVSEWHEEIRLVVDRIRLVDRKISAGNVSVAVCLVHGDLALFGLAKAATVADLQTDPVRACSPLSTKRDLDRWVTRCMGEIGKYLVDFVHKEGPRLKASTVTARQLAAECIRRSKDRISDAPQSWVDAVQLAFPGVESRYVERACGIVAHELDRSRSHLLSEEKVLANPLLIQTLLFVLDYLLYKVSK